MVDNWRVHRGPVVIEGGAIARIVFPESGGNGRVETWSPAKGAWVPGGARLSDFFFVSPLSTARAKELGIPIEPERWHAIRGPFEIAGGAVARIAIPEKGGEWRVETWSPAKGAWVPDDCIFADFDATPLSLERAKQLGVPPEELSSGPIQGQDAAAMAAHFAARSGRPIDVMIGPDPDRQIVYVIDWKNPDTRGIEHSVMLGYPSRDAAAAAYAASLPGRGGAERIQAIFQLTVPDLKVWLEFGDTTRLTKDFFFLPPRSPEHSKQRGIPSDPAERGSLSEEAHAKPRNEVGLETLVRLNGGEPQTVMSLIGTAKVPSSAKRWEEMLQALKTDGYFNGAVDGAHFVVELVEARARLKQQFHETKETDEAPKDRARSAAATAPGTPSKPSMPQRDADVELVRRATWPLWVFVCLAPGLALIDYGLTISVLTTPWARLSKRAEGEHPSEPYP